MKLLTLSTTQLFAVINAALCVGLAYVIISDGTPQWESTVGSQASDHENPDVPALIAPQAPELKVIWQQPLFSPQRRPDPQAETSTKPAQLDGVTLQGIAMDGINQWALLRMRDNRPFKIKVGEEFGGEWRLKHVTANSALFSRNGQTLELTIPMRRLPAPSPVLKLPSFSAP